MVGEDMRRIVRDADGEKRVRSERSVGRSDCEINVYSVLKKRANIILFSFFFILLLSTFLYLATREQVSHLSPISSSPPSFPQPHTTQQDKGTAIAKEFQRLTLDMDKPAKSKDFQGFIDAQKKGEAYFNDFFGLLSDVPDEL